MKRIKRTHQPDVLNLVGKTIVVTSDECGELHIGAIRGFNIATDYLNLEREQLKELAEVLPAFIKELEKEV